jgi:hypothetical protein
MANGHPGAGEGRDCLERGREGGLSHGRRMGYRVGQKVEGLGHPLATDLPETLTGEPF